ncbi:MAG: CotH kinase family protein [Saprospiraceae bacterium]|nr:CotH kinase family protein [Saprospiraceae bacterium]
MKSALYLIAILAMAMNAIAQNLPLEMRFSDDGKRLISGASQTDGFYQLNKIRVIELQFDQPDYWTKLTANYATKTDLPATLTYNGDVYPNVGVRFKGQTSYQRVTSQKKSFNITLDFADETQDLKGYETLNLNNSYEDNSYVREVLYEYITRPFCPSLKANYSHLYINGQDWGLYPNVQALDGDYVQEWFLSNEGTRWRCERSSGGGPGQPGGGFGAGTSTLNYLGDDTTLYKPNYTLKKTTLNNPWSDLVRVTKVLNTVPLDQLEDTLNKVMDIDRALWFLAKEIMFGDDDSYINKGGMDYYAIYQKDVERLIPLEYDANSVMKAQTSTWSLFLKENDTKFPLANRLFKVPALRQRYLAHVRTMFNQALDSAHYVSTLNYLYSLIDTLVQADPKKLMTYSAFQTEKNVLITWMRNRRAFVLNNTEFKQTGNTIEEVIYSVEGELERRPFDHESLTVQAKISGGPGVKTAYLYYSPGFDGYFKKTIMFDDGNHNDGNAGDGIFTAQIPPHPAGSFVRYYIESIANNTAGTISYMPEGAEHDVYIYQVKVNESSQGDIVINEFMSSNTKSVRDQDGEYDDWIELYNNSASAIDISNWILTDNPANLDKYRFPENTEIPGNGYLIIWADEDGKQNGFHANFKLSASGEEILLLDSTGLLVDSVVFGAQNEDLAYARRPNGTGPFVIQTHTFNGNNDLVLVSNDLSNKSLRIYPNPASENLHFEMDSPQNFKLKISDISGHEILSRELHSGEALDVSQLPSGFYLISVLNEIHKLIIQH